MSRRRISPITVPLLVALALVAGWQVSTHFRIPSFVWETPDHPAPATAKTVTLKVWALKCRHGSLEMEKLLFGRQDQNAIQGYLKTLIYPSPGVGEMVLTYDPDKTDLNRIARAVRLDRDGKESIYRVILDVSADLSSPAALLTTLAKSLAERNEELFAACHAGGIPGDAEFFRLVATWEELMFEGFQLTSGPSPEGVIKVAGQLGGEPIALADFGVKFDQLTIRQTGKGWQITTADWSGFKTGE